MLKIALVVNAAVVVFPDIITELAVNEVAPVPPCPTAKVPSIPRATALLLPPYIEVVFEAVPRATYVVWAEAHFVAVSAFPLQVPVVTNVE